MKKAKSSGGTQSESNSLTHSHSLTESRPRPPLNEEFKDSIPPSGHRVKAENDDDGDDEDETGYEDDDEGEGEDEDENDDEDDDGEEERGEKAEVKNGDGNGVDVAIEGKTSVERRKLAEGFYEVEFIRRKRICKGEPQYLIKWRGWPESANTWEPVDHLQTCPDVVEAYEESLRSGQKKGSRKRKRNFTQPKKKMQYTYGASKNKSIPTNMSLSNELQSSAAIDNSGQAHSQPGMVDIVVEHDEAMKRPRSTKSIDYEVPETVSLHVAGNERENSDQFFAHNTKGKNIDVHFPQPVNLDGPENCQSNANCVEVGQRRGAKRRKSGSVRRFTQDMTSLSYEYIKNATPLNISSCDRVEELMLGSSDAFRKKKFDSSRSSSVITRLIKPISYSASVTNNVQDVAVTFVAMRSDGKEVMVDNKFLRANHPQLLISFYEQHLRYSPS